MMPIVLIKKTMRRANRPVANERGMALIMAIIMLVILSVLGSVVLMSSDSEMKISGNYQVAKQTFWVADRAVEYATSREILLMNMLPPPNPNPNEIVGWVDLLTGTAPGTTNTHKELIEAAGGGVLTEGRLRDLGVGDLPASIAGSYGSDFGANYYQVSTTAQQTADTNSAAVRIETTIIRIFKNDDESIFITTGGG